jgi:hypothetical protein
VLFVGARAAVAWSAQAVPRISGKRGCDGCDGFSDARVRLLRVRRDGRRGGQRSGRGLSGRGGRHCGSGGVGGERQCGGKTVVVGSERGKAGVVVVELGRHLGRPSEGLRRVWSTRLAGFRRLVAAVVGRLRRENGRWLQRRRGGRRRLNGGRLPLFHSKKHTQANGRP